MDHRLLLHSLSSLVRPSRLGSSLYGLSSSFLGWATSLRLFLMLDFSNGSHCFFSLRICLFVAHGLGGLVRSSPWAWCFVRSWIGKSIGDLPCLAYLLDWKSFPVGQLLWINGLPLLNLALLNILRKKASRCKCLRMSSRSSCYSKCCNWISSWCNRIGVLGVSVTAVD